MHGIAAWAKLRFSNEVAALPAKTVDDSEGLGPAATALSAIVKSSQAKALRNMFLLTRLVQLIDPMEVISRARKTRTKKATLQQLVQAKMIAAGVGVLSVRGKESEIAADLAPDGTIVFNGKIFHSPSAFAKFTLQRAQCSGWQYTVYRAEGSDSWRPLSASREKFSADFPLNVTGPWPLKEVKMIVAQLSAIGPPSSDASTNVEPVVTRPLHGDETAKVETTEEAPTSLATDTSDTPEIDASTKAEPVVVPAQDKKAIAAKVKEAPISVAMDDDVEDNVIPCPAFSLTLVDWVARSKVSLETKTVEDVKAMVNSIVASAEAAFLTRHQQQVDLTPANTSIAISASVHKIALSLFVLRKLGRRLKMIKQFRSNVLTKTRSEIEHFVRLVPLHVSKFTPSWWLSQNDVELLLGRFLF